VARKRRAYFRFLALRFVFFAVFFAAAFAFLRFAIVPSELEMAYRKSAVANRPALQFDYYRTQKTATPLNETCTRTCRSRVHRRASALARERKTQKRDAPFDDATRMRARIEVVSIKQAFSACVYLHRRRIRRALSTRLRAHFQALRCQVRRALMTSKIFFGAMPESALLEAETIRNRANRCARDSLRRNPPARDDARCDVHRTSHRPKMGRNV
jgi:hypothetical protein